MLLAHFCIRLTVVLDMIRIHSFSARRLNTMMLVRIEVIGVGVPELAEVGSTVMLLSNLAEGCHY